MVSGVGLSHPTPHPKYRVTPEPKPSQLGFHPLTRVRAGPTGLVLFAIPSGVLQSLTFLFEYIGETRHT
jgi:hypothetical protein